MKLKTLKWKIERSTSQWASKKNPLVKKVHFFHHSLPNYQSRVFYNDTGRLVSRWRLPSSWKKTKWSSSPTMQPRKKCHFQRQWSDRYQNWQSKNSTYLANWCPICRSNRKLLCIHFWSKIRDRWCKHLQRLHLQPRLVLQAWLLSVWLKGQSIVFFIQPNLEVTQSSRCWWLISNRRSKKTQKLTFIYADSPWSSAQVTFCG